MRVILVGGGTAGHVNPAIALAEYIKKQDPNNRILYIGAKNGMEKDLVTQAGFEFKDPIAVPKPRIPKSALHYG